MDSINGISVTQQESDRKHKLISWVTTLVLHGIIIGALVMLGLHPPDPPLEAQGVMISLGEPDQGGPDATPAAEQPESNPQEEQPAPTPEENLATQDVEDAPVVKEEVKEKPKTETPPKEVKKPEVKKEPEQKVNTKALFTGKRTNGDPNSKGMGSGDKPGNEGDPDGSENGVPGGTGTGTFGNGTGGYDLSGRNLKHPPRIEDNSRATGKVVVTITVDKNGRVIKAEPGARGSTTTDLTLFEKAKQGALQATFSARTDGSENQVGTMTFIFKYKP